MATPPRESVPNPAGILALDDYLAILTTMSEPAFRGVPVGKTLAQFLYLEVMRKRGCWTTSAGLRNRLMRWCRSLRPIQHKGAPASLPSGRFLLTWQHDTPRVTDLMFPLVKWIGPERCAILCGRPGMVPRVPAPVRGISVQDVMTYRVSDWRRDYRRCWPQWRDRLREVAGRFDLPRGFVARAGLILTLHSQLVAGFLDLLNRARPAAIVADYDLLSTWSCLVLAGRAAGIPTYTLMHGTPGERGTGFVPLLADKVFCWGELDRQKLREGGTSPERLVLGGCPRVVRELPLSPAEARTKLGLPPDRAMVLLGAANYSPDQCRRLAETFCRAATRMDDVSFVVRLHPADAWETYAALAAQHPQVTFLRNDACSMDEAVAAADVVVVYSTGLGSDALVKRRFTVILDVVDDPVGRAIAEEYIQRGGCPRAASAEQLVETVRGLLKPTPLRQRCEVAREAFVRDCFTAFGEDSARRIAEAIVAGGSRP